MSDESVKGCKSRFLLDWWLSIVVAGHEFLYNHIMNVKNRKTLEILARS